MMIKFVNKFSLIDYFFFPFLFDDVVVLAPLFLPLPDEVELFRSSQAIVGRDCIRFSNGSIFDGSFVFSGDEVTTIQL